MDSVATDVTTPNATPAVNQSSENSLARFAAWAKKLFRVFVCHLT